MADGKILRAMARAAHTGTVSAWKTKKKTLDEQRFLADVGISYFQSHIWQQEAGLPEEEFEKHTKQVKNGRQ